MHEHERALSITRALEAMCLPSAVVDRDGRFGWLNRGATDVVGDRVGEHFTAVVAPEDVHHARELFARKLSGEEGATSSSLTVIDRDGERRRVWFSSVPLWEDGRIAGVFGIALPAPLERADALRERPSLTTRQRQTLQLLSEGLGTAAIAEELGIAEETARNHIRGLLGALSVHSRLEAVVEAHRLDLVQPRRPD
jgi:PAS domain S-box-containing protein